MKTTLKVLVAGTIGFLAIIGGYAVLAFHHRWLPDAVSNTTLIASLLLPIPTGLFVACLVYQLLDRAQRPTR